MKKRAKRIKSANKIKISPYEFARRLEVKSVDMYLGLAGATLNPLGKKLFYSLAVEEVDHAKRVDEIYGLLSGNESVRMDEKTLPSVESEMKEFFLSVNPKDLEKGNESLSGYKLAMKMEKESYNTYKRFSDGAASEPGKRFFSQLMEEEKSHYDALANVYAYLSRTGDWLEEEESKVWNWMNL